VFVKVVPFKDTMTKIQRGERLKSVRKSLDLSQEIFAKGISYGRHTLIEWEKGRADIPEDVYALLKSVYKINPEYIRTGKGNRFLPSRADSAGKRIANNIIMGLSEANVNPFISHVNDNFTKLKVFKRPGAANDIEGTEFEPIDTIVIPRQLYSPKLIPFKVIGDSMEKLIMENSIILVDTSSRELEDTKIYCFRIPYRGFTIRTVHKMPDALYLEPFNRQYKEKRIFWDDFNPEYVIGRVAYNVINPLR
jgi:DNA-binding XRE family transcriptional regulator/SOS-response transcriptional repressor LexA